MAAVLRDYGIINRTKNHLKEPVLPKWLLFWENMEILTIPWIT